MSYNNLSEISSPVEGNGEINQSSSSSSTSSGSLYFVLLLQTVLQKSIQDFAHIGN